MKKNNIILILCSFLLAVSACKKDKDDFAKENEGYTQQGFINVTMKGYSTDSIKIDGSFSADKYVVYSDASSNGYTVSDDGNEYTIDIHRYAGNNSENRVYLSFTYEKDTKYVTCDAIFTYQQKQDNNSYLSYNGTYITNMSSYDSDPNIMDFTFDPATGVLTGSYDFVIDNYGSETSVKVTGDFNVTAKKIVQ